MYDISIYIERNFRKCKVIEKGLKQGVIIQMKKIWLVIVAGFVAGFLLAGIQNAEVSGMERNNLQSEDGQGSSLSVESSDRDDYARLLLIGRPGSGPDAPSYAVGNAMTIYEEMSVLADFRDSVPPVHVVFAVFFAVVTVLVIRSVKKAERMEEDDTLIVWA